MVSKGVRNIYEVMGTLGIYSLGQKGAIHGELACYDIAFHLIEERLDTMEKCFFLQLLTEDSLSIYENLVGIRPRPMATLDNRKKLVLARLNLKNIGFTTAKIFSLIEGIGIYPQLEVDLLRESLVVQVDDILDPSMTMDHLLYYLEDILPAHLEWTLQYGDLTFDLLDEKNIPWDRWDSEEISWNQFDQANRDLLS